MTKLLPVFLLCIVLSLLYEKCSVKNKVMLRYYRKDMFFYSIIVVVMVFFAGLRVRYNDTGAYIVAYERLVVSRFNISWVIGDNPGFQVVNLFLKFLGISANGFIMFYSAVTVGIYLWFVRKYCNNFTLSIFILFTGGVYIFSFAAIKQCVAIALGLLGVDRAIENERTKFVFWILLAATFHTYVLLFFMIPLLFFKTWTKKSYFLIVISAAAGIGFQSLLGNVLSITSLLGESYDIASFNGEGVSIFRLLVALAPVMLSFIVRKHMQYENDKIENLMMNLTTVNAALMFMASLGTAFYLGRVANYFAIFPVISIPYLLRYFSKNLRILLNAVVIIGYIGYFIYAYGIVRGGFDVFYDRISVFQFFSTLFCG